MKKHLKRRIRFKTTQSLFDQLIDSLESDQTLDERIESLLWRGINHEGLNLEYDAKRGDPQRPE